MSGRTGLPEEGGGRARKTIEEIYRENTISREEYESVTGRPFPVEDRSLRVTTTWETRLDGPVVVTVRSGTGMDAARVKRYLEAIKAKKGWPGDVRQLGVRR